MVSSKKKTTTRSNVLVAFDYPDPSLNTQVRYWSSDQDYQHSGCKD